MGSGSSKKSQPPAKKTAPPKPVANVNKQNNFLDQSISTENDAKETTQHEKNAKRRDEYKNDNKKEDKRKDKENKKMKIEQKPRENMLTFEDDSDMENDIDEVLKIPVAIEYPKPKKKVKKDKNNKPQELMVNYDKKLDRDLFNNDSNGYSNEDLPVPETYAQRIQRQQYKLQQDLLIRQKTMHRNSKEWDDCDEEDENENFKSKGFDASKFRAANQGTDGKKDLFKTSAPQDELETPRYLQTEQDMDDFQVSRRPASPKRDLPSYNQSEIDLMQELERDLL